MIVRSEGCYQPPVLTRRAWNVESGVIESLFRDWSAAVRLSENDKKIEG